MADTPKSTLYLDADMRCHKSPGDDRVPYETSFFEGQEAHIEEYRIVPEGETWVRSDGVAFQGLMVSKAEPEAASPLERLADAEAALALIQEVLNEQMA